MFYFYLFASFALVGLLTYWAGYEKGYSTGYNRSKLLHNVLTPSAERFIKVVAVKEKESPKKTTKKSSPKKKTVKKVRVKKAK